jgi:hypothetical protein
VKRRSKLATEVEYSYSDCTIPAPRDSRVKGISLKPPQQHNIGERHLVRVPHAPERGVRYRSTRIRFAVVGFYLIFVPSSAALADPENGRRLADRWCSACHVVATGQRHARADVPPFSSIARGPDFDARQLAFFLLLPHPKMPSMSLSRNEATDIADYIKQLRNAN